MNWIRSLPARLRRLVTVEAWRAATLEDRSGRGRLLLLVRIGSITVRGALLNELPSRAAALSFSSLVGLAPLLALAIAVSGFVLGRDQDVAVEAAERLLEFIAPHVAEYERLAAADDAGPGAATPRMTELIQNIIRSSQSGTVGAVGFLLFIVIVIQLFTSVEESFNGIWGVSRGRRWVARIIIYWSVLTLGTLLAFAALSLVSLSAIVQFFDVFALGAEVRRVLVWSAPGIGALLLVLVLTVFYKTIPNAAVHWRSAFWGGVLVAVCLVVNHLVASVYVNRVILEKSFYGQLGIVFVLMAGMFVFWLLLLAGGVLAYAVQNANYLCRDPAWETLSHRARETCTLLVFLKIARRFKACQPPPTVLELGRSLHLPIQIVHQCLERLRDLGFVSILDADRSAELHDFRAQPARPLDRLSPADFHHAFANLGAGHEDNSLFAVDPLLRACLERTAPRAPRAGSAPGAADETFDSLIGEVPLAEADRPALAAPRRPPA